MTPLRILLTAALACAASLRALSLVDAFPGLNFQQPIFLTQAKDDSGRFFVAEQPGHIRVFNKDSKASKLFLDISAKTRTDSPEEGLLCLAFHPQFKKNHFFYVVYSLKDANPRRTIVARFAVSAVDPDQADPASETEIFSIEKPYSNHNGSCLLFDKQGLFYISLGDGGAGGDPHGNGQNLKALLGKILRIDVDRPSAKHLYSIPKDNPFADSEVYAYGLRNPWRMSFDRSTGDLWAGDVGQNKYEEVDLIKKGGNYGWNFKEGAHYYQGDPKSTKLIPPVLDYDRSEGSCVTGGYVYRGKKVPELYGKYVFGDFASRHIWALPARRPKASQRKALLSSDQAIASFAEDNEGELYVVGYDGKIFEFK